MGIKLPKCPNCSALLKIDHQEHSFYCEYCGAKIFDARLKEAEIESRRMELEYEQKRKAYENGSTRDTLYRKDGRVIKRDLVIFCQKCGSEIAEGGAFCPTCGTLVGQVTQGTNQPIIVNVVNTNSYGGHGNYPYRSKWAAFFLCLFFGGLGIHRFYVGKNGTGIIWLFTIGLFSFGWITDLLLILFGAFRDKAGYPLR
jgi:DNA-directed RNA polymerase subunit RPC12/RpoP